MKKTYCLLSVFLILFSTTLRAEEGGGVILKADGDVSIVNKSGEKRAVDQEKMVVQELDTIVTNKGGKAVISFSNGALTVLDEKSSLRVEEKSWFSHIGGKIYFTFRKVFGPARQVKTNFSTIGVRGTTFIVYDDDNGEGVALQEGELEIESPGEAYEIHRKQAADDFEAFKQQAKQNREQLAQEFKDYKDTVQKEFIEYKKSFTLKPNRVIKFDGNRVDETEIGDDVAKDFSSFEQEAGAMLEEFRKKAAEHREKTKAEEEE